jgi:Xaa-Pro aminopeptidase
LEARLDTAYPGFAVKDATPVFAKLRAVKSPRELDILQQAVDISAEGFQRAFALAVPGAWEYEIQAQFEFTFLRRNAHWGYPPIVGSGHNATTLHYETNRGRMASGDLLLIDAGAEFDGYSADVTRTIPVSGKFSPEQAAIYNLVWAAQHAAIAAAHPGEPYTARDSKLRAAAVKVLNQGLFKLGLVTDPDGAEYSVWLNHGISHSIGLNVHDPDAHELSPGMVVTVEPGLYIRPDALDRLPKTPRNERFVAAVRPAFEKYKGIGVRIEDDILITAGGAKVLSAGIPSRLEEVEAAVAAARRAIRGTPLP